MGGFSGRSVGRFAATAEVVEAGRAEPDQAGPARVIGGAGSEVAGFTHGRRSRNANTLAYHANLPLTGG